MTLRTLVRIMTGVAVCAPALTLAAIPASAQFGPGRLMPDTNDPKTYKPGWDGKIEKNWPAPVPGFKGGVGVLPGGGSCGPVVIVIGNSPLYVPGYYGFGYGGYGYSSYGNTGVSANLGLGGLQLGYRQNSGYGYNNYNQIPYNPQNRSGYSNTYNNAYNNGRNRLNQNQQGNTQPQTPRSNNATNRNPEEDSYYLSRKPTPQQRDPALAQAIADIQATFRGGTIASLTRHVNPNDTLTFQSQGNTRKPIQASAYLQMTEEALKVMKTSRYDLNKVEPASNGGWLVYGTHVIRGEDGAERAFNVGFVLQKRGEVWMITEVSADPAK